MSPALRWASVALVTVAVLTPAVLHRAIPAQASDLSPAALADQARASTDRGWSGEVSTLGTLAVPEVENFAGVSRLFGSAGDLRVWWRDQEHWRIDRVRQSGEADLARKGTRVYRWTYESQRATITRWSSIRLPYDADVLPSTLAARLLAGAKDRDLSALPSRRIDGRSAAGFRYTPSDTRTSLSAIDVWNDASSGVPLRVEVRADGAPAPILSTETSAFRAGAPADDRTEFEFPPGLRLRTSYALDDAAGANAFAPFRPPATLGGLKRTGDLEGAVGVYGQGPTAMVLIPLRRGLGYQVYKQISSSPGAVRYDGIDVGLRVGPLGVLLTGQQGAAFLITGTVDAAVMDKVRADLAKDPVEFVEPSR